MPRPDTITEQQIDAWSEEFENSPGIPKWIPVHVLKEIYIAGVWLGQCLYDSGARSRDSEAACEAFGQRAFAAQLTRPNGFDCWELAQGALTAFDAGIRDTPGPELAERLYQGANPFWFGTLTSPPPPHNSR